MAASTRMLAPNADIVSRAHALMANCAAAKGLQSVLKTNLGASILCIYILIYVYVYVCMCMCMCVCLWC